ncbi:helix-turn-helix domain-containing protein [Acidobacteriota bacterium]
MNNLSRSQLKTVDQISKLFQVSPRTIHRWAKLGFLPSVVFRPPGSRRKSVLRFEEHAIRKFIEGNRRKLNEEQRCGFSRKCRI